MPRRTGALEVVGLVAVLMIDLKTEFLTEELGDGRFAAVGWAADPIDVAQWWP